MVHHITLKTYKEDNFALKIKYNYTIEVVSLKSVHEEVYSIQHHVIMFVSDLRQVGGFLRFPPQIKLTTTI